MFDSVAQLKRRIKEEIKRLQRRRLIPRFLGGPTPAITATFAGHAKDENVVASCSGSFRSMALRSPTSDSQDSDSDQSPLRTSEPIFQTLENVSVVSSQSSLKPTHTIDSMPIFTLPQVTALCERLIKEREAELREEYDSILSCKLAGVHSVISSFEIQSSKWLFIDFHKFYSFLVRIWSMHKKDMVSKLIYGKLLEPIVLQRYPTGSSSLPSYKDNTHNLGVGRCWILHR
ncbi:uncharacterized protein DC041_0004543 [Schistosoma bovis]|uniref:Uncharacterized protein n=1 Tax=Schistosoma bovis TaxID=6184 RepID=A0A430Q7V2_SCHBO|nr:uncharacterized protein DC041_0004543 [Schistosoma bovis]